MSNLIGHFRQIGIVTHDADTTMRYWAERLGVGPFLVNPEVEFDDYAYYGEPTRSPVIRCGVAHSGPLQIEVIQQLNDAPSAFRDFLASGREGIQHISSWPETGADYGQLYDDLRARGFEIAQQGYLAETDVRYAYFTQGRGAAAMPFLEISEAMKVPVYREAFAQLQALNETWDGKDPIRLHL